MLQEERGMIKHKKSAPCRVIRRASGPDISKYALYDGLVRVLLAHGALSVSGATPFATCVIEEIGVYFLPSSV
jgi:hypothetical protein